MKALLLFVAFFATAAVSAQPGPGKGSGAPNFVWHDAEWALGVCETDPAHIFYRLPGRLEGLVPKGVWEPSTNAAGEYLHFRTTARSFIVRYGIAGKTYSFPHMPATGVSGVDLYARDAHGVMGWASPARYSFGDTCVYEYRDLQAAGDYYIYLPLYASLQWISIGVSSDQQVEFLRQNAGLPIVAYGTSILQGACASRPGLAWTNILSRNLDRTVVNLGFSGNGRFDAPIFDLMARTKARLYILDCMPNLLPRTKYPADTIEQRLRYGIARLRAEQPDVPILLAEHAGGYAPLIDTAVQNKYHECSLTIRKIFQKLEREGVRNIYLLSEAEIGFNENSTVEGTHPTDIGMMQYARAYEKKIRAILRL